MPPITYQIDDDGDGKPDRRLTARALIAWIRDHPGRRVRAWRARAASPRDRVLAIARGELGVREDPPGSNTGARVRQYQAATTQPGTGWPYCMAFVVWCCLEAGVGIEYRGAYVPHFEQWARDHDRWRSQLPKAWRTRLVAVVMEFNGDTIADHVGLLERGDAGTIEANTSPTNAGSQANGGGVYRRDRARGVIRGYVLIA